jgi:CRISPR/Cas system-associated endonuclease/helicase Cas3
MIAPTGYKISQEIEDYVFEGNALTVEAIRSYQEREELKILYKMLITKINEDYYRYCG